jgi:hypothetical protein
MCFHQRNLEVLEVLEDFEDDDPTDTEEPEEPQDCDECATCDECTYQLIMLNIVNHMLVKCGEEPIDEKEWLSLPSKNKMRVVMYVHNLRKGNLEEVPSTPEEEEDMDVMEVAFNAGFNAMFM